MRTAINRKANPRVIDGRVQKKNNATTTHNYYDHKEPELVIDRRRPGPGARHLLKIEDIRRFIEIIPQWETLSHGIDAIALLPYDDRTFGSYNYAGVIKIRAWPTKMWIEMDENLTHRKRWLIQSLGVETEELTYGGYLAKFTESQAKAFQLLGTFLHELGHHLDRMVCKGKHDCPGGEPFAIQFEQETQKIVWPEFIKRFDRK
jgi:hypothetical protein